MKKDKLRELLKEREPKIPKSKDKGLEVPLKASEGTKKKGKS